jgi:hypothetical protein
MRKDEENGRKCEKKIAKGEDTEVFLALMSPF